LYQAGVPSGLAAALVLASGLIAQLLLVIASVALALWPSSPLGAEGGLTLGVSVLRWLVFIYTVGLVAFFFLVWHAEAGGRRVVEGTVGFLRRRGWFSPVKLEAMREGLMQFLTEVNHAFRDLVSRRPRAAAAAVGGYVLYFILFFSIAPVL